MTMADRHSELLKAKAMVSQEYNRSAIRLAPNLNPGESHVAVVEVQNYLKRYGYLAPETTVSPGQLDAPTVKALSDFQGSFKVGVAGVLDASTRATLSASRCGLPDVLDPLAFNTIGAWNRRNFTYTFGTLSGQVGNNVTRDSVRRAFDTMDCGRRWPDIY